jgi:hypothetical protein
MTASFLEYNRYETREEGKTDRGAGLPRLPCPLTTKPETGLGL